MLAANLLRRASMPAVEARKPMAAGRKWLRSYFNGCAFKVFDAALPPTLLHKPFLQAAEWLFRTANLALIGVACPTYTCCTAVCAVHQRLHSVAGSLGCNVQLSVGAPTHYAIVNE